jgi:hypothetical protein
MRFSMSEITFDLSAVSGPSSGAWSIVRIQAHDVDIEKITSRPVAPNASWTALASRNFTQCNLIALGQSALDVADQQFARPVSNARIVDCYFRGEPEPQVTANSPLVPIFARKAASLDISGNHFGDFYEPFQYSTGTIQITATNPTNGTVITVRSVQGTAPTITAQALTYTFVSGAPSDVHPDYQIQIGANSDATFTAFLAKISTSIAGGANIGVQDAGADIDLVTRTLRLYSQDVSANLLWAPVAPFFLDKSGGNSASSLTLTNHSECQEKHYQWKSAMMLEDCYSSKIMDNTFGPGGYDSSVVDIYTTGEHGALTINPWAEGPHFTIDGNLGHTISYDPALFRVRTHGFGTIGLGNTFGQLGIGAATDIRPAVMVEKGTSASNTFRAAAISSAGDYHWCASGGHAGVGSAGELLSVQTPFVYVDSCFGNCTIGPLRLQHMEPINPDFKFQVSGLAIFAGEPANNTIITVDDDNGVALDYEFTDGALTTGDVKVDMAGANSASQVADKFAAAIQGQTSQRVIASSIKGLGYVVVVRGKAGASGTLLAKTGDGTAQITLVNNTTAGSGIVAVDSQGARYPIFIKNPGWVTVTDVTAVPYSSSTYSGGNWAENNEYFVIALSHPTTTAPGVSPKLVFVTADDATVLTHRVHIQNCSVFGPFAGIVDVGGTASTTDITVQNCLVEGKPITAPW